MADVANTLLVVFDEHCKHLFQYPFVLAPTDDIMNYIYNLLIRQLADFYSVDGKVVGGAAFNVSQFHIS